MRLQSLMHDFDDDRTGILDLRRRVKRILQCAFFAIWTDELVGNAGLGSNREVEFALRAFAANVSADIQGKRYRLLTHHLLKAPYQTSSLFNAGSICSA